MSIYGVDVDHDDDWTYRNFKPSSISWGGELGATQTYDCLNAYTRGFDDTGRVGRSILMKRIVAGFYLSLDSPDSGTADRGNPSAVVVVYDRFSKGSLPTWSTIFGANTPSAICNIYPERFEILFHKLYALQPAVKTTGNYSESGGETTIIDRFDIKLNHITTYNSGNAGNYLDIQSGALWLLTLGIASEPIYQCVGNAVLYTDDH